jgi:ribonucleoside-diphosphate reductase alpha chain
MMNHSENKEFPPAKKSKRMYVITRSGDNVPVYFDKITVRNQQLSHELNIDPQVLSKKVIEGIYSGIKTEDIDKLSAETALYMSTHNPDFEILAKRIIISNMHKKTQRSFSYVTKEMKKLGLLNENYSEFIKNNSSDLDNIPNFERDYDFSYFGYKTFEKSYLNKNIEGEIIERPQHLWLRVATFLRMPDIPKIKEVYDMLSLKYFTHATPTLYHCGFKYAQLSSCFLLSMEDKLEDMYECVKRGALISKFSGGIGINVSMLRPKGSRIYSTGGKSDGIVPFLKVWNSTARHVNQGGGKRKGSVAVYLEPWHPDIFDFLNIRKNNTKEEEQCLDIHIGLWIPDLFMKRLKEKGEWCLFDPNKVKGLYDMYGEEFEEKYLDAEKKELYDKKIKITDLWKEILISQMETGEPYILYKDHINRKNNQKNRGVIRGSNLCAEILEYTDNDNVAVCNLCSISLPSFVNKKDKTFDYDKLGKITRTLVENMNIVIDKNYYPVSQAEKSNIEMRPTGIGVQGLADVFQMLELAWSDKETKDINRKISAVIYYNSLKSSMELAKKDGPYKYFKNSPLSKGILQPDMWGVKVETLDGKLDWDTLREDIKKHGVRNSLLTSQMPTASTAQILGNNESIEPYTSNMYSRQVLSGNFPVINKHLYNKLEKEGLWNNENVNKIIRDNGSIQNIDGIDSRTKEIFKTAWELPMKTMVNFSADRGAYICQTQSFNCFMAEPTMAKLSSLAMYTWQKGLKTSNYYVRRQSKVNAVKFSLMDVGKSEQKKSKITPPLCTPDEDGVCLMCSG